MPAPTHVIIIAPIAKVVDCTSIIGITPTAPLYTSADAPIRSITHRASSGPMTISQRAIVDAHIASPNPGLIGVSCTLWLRSDPSPYEAIVASLGLTNHDGDI